MRRLREESQKTSQAVAEIAARKTEEVKVASIPIEVAKPEPPKPQATEAGPKLAIFPMYITQDEERERERNLRGIQLVVDTMDLFGEVLSYYDYQGRPDIKRIGKDLPAGEIWKRKSMFSHLEPDVEAVCREGKKLGVDAVLTLYEDFERDHALCVFYVINVGNRKVYSAKSTLTAGQSNANVYRKMVRQALEDYKKDR